MRLQEIASYLITGGAVIAIILAVLDFFDLHNSNQITSVPIESLTLFILRVVVAVLLFQRSYSRKLNFSLLLSMLVMFTGLFMGYIGGLLVFIGGLLILLDIQFN